MRDRLTILWPPDGGTIEDIDEELHVCNYCEQVFTEGKEIAYRHVAMAGHISRDNQEYFFLFCHSYKIIYNKSNFNYLYNKINHTYFDERTYFSDE